MSSSITTRRRITRMIVLALAVGAMAPSQAGARGFGGGGNPQAVPPLLPPVTPAELREIRRAEAAEARARAYRLPSTARYSDTEMDAYTLDAICAA